ncbi:MAG: hypothetical protein WDO19_14075 [Bacteroidota bacterium]
MSNQVFMQQTSAIAAGKIVRKRNHPIKDSPAPIVSAAINIFISAIKQ